MSPAALSIEELKNLPANWDSYGAPPVALSACRHAQSLVTDLEKMLAGKYVDPLVGPDVGGGVELIWEASAGSLEVHLFVPPFGIPKALVLQNERLIESREAKSAEDILAILRNFSAVAA